MIPWTVTITGLIGDEAEIDAAIVGIASLLGARPDGDIIVSAQPAVAELAAPLQQPKRRRRTYIGACPECGAQAGLHALSCQHYEIVPAEPEHLSDACLAELRALPPSQWHGWRGE